MESQVRNFCNISVKPEIPSARHPVLRKDGVGPENPLGWDPKSSS